MMKQSDYYRQTFVLFEMCKSLQNRYMSAKKIYDDSDKPIFTRYYMGFYVDALRQALERLGAYKDTRLKLYYDLATWKETPWFSWNPQERKKQRKNWDEESKKKFKMLDFAVDLDAPIHITRVLEGDEWKNLELTEQDKKTLEKCKQEALRVVEWCEKNGYEHSIRFSGKKGFHIVIPATQFDIRMGDYEAWEQHHTDLAEDLEDELSLTMMDMSVYDMDRVLALPYALSEVGLVVLPLTKEQLQDFTIEQAQPEHVLKTHKIMGRGLLWRKVIN